MINLTCANYTIIELHGLHKSFVSSIVVFDGSTELRMRAQYSYLSHEYDDGTPGRPTWDTTPNYRTAQMRICFVHTVNLQIFVLMVSNLPQLKSEIMF